MYRPGMNRSVFTTRLWLQETSTTADTRQPMGADQEERAIVVVAADGAPVKVKAAAALQLAVQRVRERVHQKVGKKKRAAEAAKAANEELMSILLAHHVVSACTCCLTYKSEPLRMHAINHMCDFNLGCLATCT
jgi:hypothetical protein